MKLEQLIKEKSVKIGVIGLGYVGLPLAKEFAQAGVTTVGFDLDQIKVDSINRGESYIPDVPTTEIKKLAAQRLISATTDFGLLSGMDVVFICVPTPFTPAKDPDISYIIAATKSIKAVLKPGQLIVLQSTTYPGTTDEVVLPMLEETGLKAGSDFYLAFSPERIDPGNKKFNAKNTPKVVGGLNKVSTDLACLVFSLIIESEKIFPVSSPRVAEFCKLLENTFRSVNIALVNELTLLCDRMGVSIWEIIEAASTKPFGFMPFLPGPGVGGHCIPVDPYYLSWKAREFNFYTKFIELAAEVNQGMPNFTVNKLARILNDQGKSLKGAKILALGAAFKPDIDDARNSPAIDVIQMLLSYGCNVQYSDPFIPSIKVSGVALNSTQITDRALADADCVLVLVRHSAFNYQQIADKAKIVFDTVNAIKGPAGNADKVHKL